MPEEIIHQKHRLSSFQIIISGFVGVILLGALLLMLPVSTTEGCITPFNETLFTATSAVCVTGLVVQDTGSYGMFFLSCAFWLAAMFLLAWGLLRKRDVKA